MSAIPIHDFDAVVTKADLRAEMAELHAEMLSEIGSLRNTMTNWFMMQSAAVIGAILSAIVGVALLT